MIKARFSAAVEPGKKRSPARIRHGERGIWQRGYWEHTIRDERDLGAHIDETHFNPVRHGLVTTAAAWPYSSFHRAVARGMYPADWARGTAAPVESGERWDDA